MFIDSFLSNIIIISYMTRYLREMEPLRKFYMHSDHHAWERMLEAIGIEVAHTPQHLSKKGESTNTTSDDDSTNSTTTGPTNTSSPTTSEPTHHTSGTEDNNPPDDHHGEEDEEEEEELTFDISNPPDHLKVTLVE